MKINKTQTWMIVIFFWFFISLLTYFQDIIVTNLEGYKNDLFFTGVFYIGWLLWIPLTLLVVKIAKAYPIHRNKIIKSFSIHFIFSILVAALHFLLEVIIMLLLFKLIFAKRDAATYIPSYMLMKIHIQVLIYFLILAVYHSIKYVLQFQNALIENITLESKLNEAQNQALKMQIRPHFLFNTHHSIISLLHENENGKAIKMLIGLSDLLRKTLDQPATDLVFIEDELSIAKLYLTIQEIRFEDRLKVFYDVDPAVEKNKIPPFILQPIIENAIIHGIEPFSDSGKVSIAIHRNEDHITIQIEDDGVGMVKGILKEGIGISNIRSRLQNMYGNNFGFTLKNHPVKGTVVKLILPLLNKETHAR